MGRHATGPTVTRILRATAPPSYRRRGYSITQLIPDAQLDRPDLIAMYARSITAEMRTRGMDPRLIVWTVELW